MNRHPSTVPDQLALALEQFASKHELPNAITPKELHELHGGPFPFDLGWHMRYNRTAINEAALTRGIRVTRFYRPEGHTLKRIVICAA